MIFLSQLFMLNLTLWLVWRWFWHLIWILTLLLFLFFFICLCRVVQHLATKYCNTFESLELDGNELSDSTIYFVSFCHRLKTLSISFCERLTDLTVKYLLVRQYLPLFSDVSFIRSVLSLVLMQELNQSLWWCYTSQYVVVMLQPISCGNTIIDPISGGNNVDPTKYSVQFLVATQSPILVVNVSPITVHLSWSDPVQLTGC